jgi:hypothetical protein
VPNQFAVTFCRMKDRQVINEPKANGISIGPGFFLHRPYTSRCAMFRSRPCAHGPRMRPSLEAMEERALLDAALPHVKHLAAHAEVSAAKRAPVPIVSQLPSAPTSRITTVPANGD